MTVHPVNMMVMSTAGTGPGDLELMPVTGWRTAADAAGTGEANPFWYTIRHTGAAEYEIGRGHVDSETGRLVRGEVVEGSNGNAPVDFSEGVKEVTSSTPVQYLRAMGIDRSVTIDAATPTTVVDRLNSLLDLLQVKTPVAPFAGQIHKWTIPAGTVTEDVTDFPADIFLNSTDSPELFAGTNPWKNWKTMNGGTQCPAEVVSFEATIAHIVVKIPSVTAAAGAEVQVTMEGSSQESFIGVTGSAQAKAVWGTNYKAVYHMTQDPSVGGAYILDSTANAYHGTPSGNMSPPTSEGLYFDGIDDGVIFPGALSGHVGLWTWEMAYSSSDRDNNVVLESDKGNAGSHMQVSLYGDGKLWFGPAYYSGDPGPYHVQSAQSLATGLLVCVAGVHASEGTKFVIDGVPEPFKNCGPTVAMTDLVLGKRGSIGMWNATVRSIRISTVVRSDAYLMLSDKSLRDTLFTYSKTEAP